MKSDVVVFKIGSQVLLNQDGRLDLAYVDSVAEQLAAVQRQGLQPVLVSSGAIACGRGLMNDPEMEQTLADRQALAALGQSLLAHRWQVALDAHGLKAAQLLLTNEDFKHRQRYLNITATLRSLFDHQIIPVVNENDTVAVEELTLGDNDRLSAMLAAQLHARQLIILTDIDGVYTSNPQKDPQATLIPLIEQINAELIDRYCDRSSGVHGRGGMRSKLQAALIAAEAGVATQIVAGRQEQVLQDAAAGKAVGTRICARADGTTPDSRRRWLGLARNSEGRITIDDGARRALLKQGTSLLPVGVTAVDGVFKRGDTVSICDARGAEIARGLCSFSAGELRQIAGLRMDIAAETLGYVLPKAAVHRDNLLLLNQQ